MFDHQQHIFPHENISLPRWCWLLLLVAGLFSSGCYPPLQNGDRTPPTDEASDQPSGQPWATTDGEALPAVAVTCPAVRLQAWPTTRHESANNQRLAFPREVRETLPSIEGIPAEAKLWLEGFILPTPARWLLVLGTAASGVISPCGRRGAARVSPAAWIGPLTIYDLERYAPLREVGLTQPRCAAFSPDGTRLLIQRFPDPNIGRAGCTDRTVGLRPRLPD